RISALRWRCGGSIGHLPTGAHSWVLVNPNPILLLSASVRTAGVPLVQTSSLKSWNLRHLVPWLRGKVVAPRSLSETKQCLILISQHERKRLVCPRFPNEVMGHGLEILKGGNPTEPNVRKIENQMRQEEGLPPKPMQ